jgi:hypothetical protein
MQNRAIKAHLKEVAQNWFDSLEEGPHHINGSADGIRHRVGESGIIIAGGALVSLYTGEVPNDYDIFFPDLVQRNAVHDFYAKCIETPGVYCSQNRRGEFCLDEQHHAGGYVINKDDVTGKHLPKIITPNAVTLGNNVQLITRHYGITSQVLKSFDFDHTRLAYKYPANELVLDKNALSSILTKELRYGESDYPLAALIRAHKFINRGFTFPFPELLKIILQINALDLSDPDVLKDQLMGVSRSMALSFVEKLAEKQEETGLDLMDRAKHRDNFEIVCELIDSFFGDLDTAEAELVWAGV